MVEITLTTLDKENLPHCYVAARFGETQKLGRLSAEKVYRFPQEVLGEQKCAFIDVFQRVGGCKVNYDPEERDQLVTLPMRLGGNLSLRVNVGTSAGKKPSERETPKTSDKDGDPVRQRLMLAKSYMAKHNLEMRLKSAVQAAMETLPDDPVAFIARQLLETKSEATASEAPGTLSLRSGNVPQGQASVSSCAKCPPDASEDDAERYCKAQEQPCTSLLTGETLELHRGSTALLVVADFAEDVGTSAAPDAEVAPANTSQIPSTLSSPCKSEMWSPTPMGASTGTTKESVAKTLRSCTKESVARSNYTTNQSEYWDPGNEEADIATSPWQHWQPGAITVSKAADCDTPSPAAVQMQTIAASSSTSSQTIRANSSMPEVILEIEVPSPEAWERMLVEAYESVPIAAGLDCHTAQRS